MAGLKVSVHTNFTEELTHQLASASNPAEHTVAIQVAKDTEPFVPFLKGRLSYDTKVDGGYVIYPGPYARYLYYGKLMVDPDTGSSWAPKGATKVITGKDLDIKKRPGHSQAQSHWFEASKAQNLEKWVRIAGKAVKRYL